MKVSKEPTQDIMIKASISSEWDYTDAAHLSITGDWLELVAERCRKADSMKEPGRYDFHYISYWDSPNGYYILDGNDNVEVLEALKKQGWCYVILEEDELDTISQPEQSIDAEQMKVFSGGLFSFTGYGKHTDEQFRTEYLKLEDLKIPTNEHSSQD